MAADDAPHPRWDEEVKVEAMRWAELPWHHAPVTFDDDRYLDVFVD